MDFWERVAGWLLKMRTLAIIWMLEFGVWYFEIYRLIHYKKGR